MKYSLRSLMIVVLVLPPLLAAVWFLYPAVWRGILWRIEDYRFWGVGAFGEDCAIASACGVVSMASGFAFLKKRKPAMLVATILATLTLLGWLALVLQLL